MENLQEELCVLCGRIPHITLGIALGMSGNDYPLCNFCIKTKTIQQLLVAIEAISSGVDFIKL